ncbi:hypothetical protein AB0D57_24640 [Streptomyces sp. NPDC048275]|uniref:hypothetical protein n=1 Tax=Streptomyces sp. NPDC048275 TaxID=3155629 RepID=UPI0033F47E3B
MLTRFLAFPAPDATPGSNPAPDDTDELRGDTDEHTDELPHDAKGLPHGGPSHNATESGPS